MVFVVFHKLFVSQLYKKEGMKRPSFSFPSIWVSCISFLFLFLLPSLSNGRAGSPSSAPSFSPQGKLISATSMPVAPSPTVTQVVMVVQLHHLNRELIIAISCSSLAIAVIVLSIIFSWVFWQRNRRDLGSKDIQDYNYATKGLHWGPIFSKLNSLKSASKKTMVAIIEYSSLELATNNFSENNILREGGLACVYQACFDGRVLAAVKKFDGNGQDYGRMFDNELDLLGRIRHPNIVSLLGCCIHENSRFLVYGLLENGSLETQLHGPSHGSALTWHLRMKIALDTARGLEYLHEHCYPPVIHRDLKSSCILLDSDFTAKISDFGLAVSGRNNNKGKITEKSDVYAFGVVLLELLIGRKPVETMAPSQCQSLVTWAMPQLTDKSKLLNIVDSVISNTMDLKHLYQVAAVAVLCVQPEPSYRPLITDVLHSLIPLVPVELGGTLRVSESSPRINQKSC